MKRLSRKREFYVYVLLDPRKPGPYWFGHWKFDFLPFYVGKGKGTRYSYHVRALRKSDLGQKANKIRKILNSGNAVACRILRDSMTEREAFDLEVKLIAKIGRPLLVNHTCGGEGRSGFVFSQEARDRISAVCKKRYADLSVKERKERASRIPVCILPGGSNPQAAFTDKQVFNLRLQFERGLVTMRQIQEQYNATYVSVRNMLKGKTYSTVRFPRNAKRAATLNNRGPGEGRPSSVDVGTAKKAAALASKGIPLSHVAQRLGLSDGRMVERAIAKL